MHPVQIAIAKAKAYGNGTLPITGTVEHEKARTKYRQLPLEKLDKALDKADEWFRENRELETKNPDKWAIATIRIDVIREVRAERIVEAVS